MPFRRILQVTHLWNLSFGDNVNCGVWHFGHCFLMFIEAPVISVVTVCKAGKGVCMSSVVRVAIFLCRGVKVLVRVAVSVVLSLYFLVERFVKM